MKSESKGTSGSKLSTKSPHAIAGHHFGKSREGTSASSTPQKLPVYSSTPKTPIVTHSSGADMENEEHINHQITDSNYFQWNLNISYE